MDEVMFKIWVDTQTWIKAKTAIRNPHEYTLIMRTPKEAFYEAVMFIREHGREVMFWKKPYICYDLGEYRYWTMGCPLSETILINRAKNEDRRDEPRRDTTLVSFS